MISSIRGDLPHLRDAVLLGVINGASHADLQNKIIMKNKTQKRNQDC